MKEEKKFYFKCFESCILHIKRFHLIQPRSVFTKLLHTEAKTNQCRYQKSLPSTRNRLNKRVRPHETARPAGSTYAGPVSGAVLPPQNTPKAAKKTSRAWLPWLPFWLFSTVDLATCSSCSSPCPLDADGCGRGAVDFALTSVS